MCEVLCVRYCVVCVSVCVRVCVRYSVCVVCVCPVFGATILHNPVHSNFVPLGLFAGGFDQVLLLPIHLQGGGRSSQDSTHAPHITAFPCYVAGAASISLK